MYFCSMIIRGTIQDIHDYRLSEDVSQSFLKEVVMRSKPIKTKFRESVTGDIIDMYLTLPNEVEDFYTVYEGKMPSDKLQEILTSSIEYLASKGTLTPNINDHRALILKLAREFDPNKSDATKFAQIADKSSDWWNFVTKSWGKNVISEKDRSFGAEVAKLTEKHKISGPFFQELPDRDYYYQVPIYFEHNGVNCKILTDIVIVSHVKKVVMITEIKTIFMATPYNISSQIKQYGYPDQLSFYEVGVRSILPMLGAEGYEIVTNFLFIPKDIREEGKWFAPVIWPCTREMKDWARFGGTYKSGNVYEGSDPNGQQFTMTSEKQVDGWEAGLEMYKHAIDNKLPVFGALSNQPLTPEKVNTLFFT